MALLDRLLERVESDLTPPELEAILAEAQEEIRSRFGPDRSTADPLVPITVEMVGGAVFLDLARPLDAAEDAVVTEHDGHESTATTSVLVVDEDYRVLNGGRTLRRIAGGDYSRNEWASRVTLAYVPVDDQPARDEVALKLALLAIDYQGGRRYDRVGDSSTGYADYQTDRERHLASLAPRKGMMLA